MVWPAATVIVWRAFGSTSSPCVLLPPVLPEVLNEMPPVPVAPLCVPPVPPPLLRAVGPGPARAARRRAARAPVRGAPAGVAAAAAGGDAGGHGERKEERRSPGERAMRPYEKGTESRMRAARTGMGRHHPGHGADRREHTRIEARSNARPRAPRSPVDEPARVLPFRSGCAPRRCRRRTSRRRITSSSTT